MTAAGAGIVEEGAGNALTVDATDSWVVETTGPTVTINQASGQADPVKIVGSRGRACQCGPRPRKIS